MLYLVSLLANSLTTQATVTVTDIVPLTGVTWTCTSNGYATSPSCPSPTGSGSGNIVQTVTLRPNGPPPTINWYVTGTVSPSATGDLVNTATVQARTPTGTTFNCVQQGTTGTSCSATVTLTRAPTSVSIVKVSETGTEYVPGTTVTYDLTVSNAGPGDILGATIVDDVPLTNVTWSCTAVSSNCVSGEAPGTGASGTGNIDQTVDLQEGGQLSFRIDGTVAPSATGDLANTGTVQAPPGVPLTCISGTQVSAGSCSATATLAPGSPELSLSVTKTGEPDPYVPGQTVTYTIGVENGGPSDAIGATVTDTFPAQLENVTWTCTATGDGSCTGSGNGNIADQVTVAAGGGLTYMVTGTVVPGTTGPITNTATVTPPAGATDTTCGTGCSDSVTLQPGTADLAVTKTVQPSTAGVGENVTFTVTVTNNGPDTATGVTLSDALPAGLTFDSANPSQGAYAGGVWDVGTLADGGKATLDIVATAASPGRHTNTAEVTHSDQTDTDSDNNAASATVTVTPAPTPIPTPTPISAPTPTPTPTSSVPGQPSTPAAPSVPGQRSVPGLPNTGAPFRGAGSGNSGPP